VTTRADVVVLGAGPAGAVVARRLAADGAAVVVVPGTPPAAAREGYSRRTRERLLEEGLDEVLATLEGPVPRGGRWGDGRAVEGLEWLADRARVAGALEAALARAGVTRLAGPATRVARTGSGFTVESATGRVEARLVVDARGRRGPQSRGPLLLALGRGYAHASGRPATRIEPWSQGWCWLADDGEQVFVQLVGAARGGGRPLHWFPAAAAEVAGLREILAAPAAGPLVARPAHARLGRASPDPGVWRVGDAALALDPLSGQGVYEALRGATAVAAALRTVLEGGDAALASRFVAERYGEAWWKAVASAARFYAENAARGGFWTETAAAYAALAPRVAAGPARIERRPVLEDDRIRERAVLVTAAAPRGAWHVEGVPLVALLDLVREAAPAAPALLDAARRLDRPAAAVETALRWLKASGALAAPRGAPISSGV
jgi:flavin-dependent dehydrogenase